ncbi:TIGR00730 family Rossman fold protein [Amaricoccus sp.]|uniref:LOG family protein n=1 Tax=Amaricoccus sp. TaxID=1872485 RepID=UPI001B5633B3|nr:TIGR00730 family Rossman fold protein [Amaricoccus sp.]MBP7240458.1 TIGR00730 family Rossman fold protein [Amaricoccus sp.]
MSVAARASVCVFCGSRYGADPAYAEAARALGAGLAGAGLRLVYGAGDVGLMGETARAAQAAGGATFGVIPKHLADREVARRDLSVFVVTETMHERKKVMFMNADAVVALPGGPGTLDELFEVLTWRQLGLHEKPVYLLDVGGYWAPLRALLGHLVAAGFAEPEFLTYLEVAPTVPDLIARLRRRLG